MKKYSVLVFAALAFVCGCSSHKASYVDAGGSRSVVTTNKINIADWNAAAAALVNKMLASGCLEKFDQPVRMQVSRITNRTTQTVDTDLLTQQICDVLNQSGKVLTISQDASTQELAKYEAFKKGGNVATPRITMTGKIIEDRDSNEDVREVTYIFMLQINAGGDQIWSDQKQIAKQSNKGWF